MGRRATIAGISIATALLALTACGAAPGDQPPLRDNDVIVVASFDFDESEVLGELYVQALQASGFDAVHTPRAGTREVLLPALERGLVEVVPEYAGSAVEFLGGTATVDPALAHETLRLMLGLRGIAVAEAAAAQSRNGLVVSAETAAEHGLRSIGDLRALASEMTLGGPPECPDRDLCLPGFEQIYGLEFGSFLPLDAGGPITAEAVQRGTVDVGVLFTSDGSLAEHGLVLLEDDRRLQPAENVTPLVRRAVVARSGGGVIETLDAVSSQLTTDDLRLMNAAVRSGTTPRDAAAAWLAEHRSSAAPG